MEFVNIISCIQICTYKFTYIILYTLHLSEQMMTGTPSVTQRINAWSLVRITSPLVRIRHSLRQTIAAICLLGSLSCPVSFWRTTTREGIFQGSLTYSWSKSRNQALLQVTASLSVWTLLGGLTRPSLALTLTSLQFSWSSTTGSHSSVRTLLLLMRATLNPKPRWMQSRQTRRFLSRWSYICLGRICCFLIRGPLDGHPPISKRFSLLAKTTKSYLTRGSFLRGRAIMLLSSRYVCLCVYSHFFILTYCVTLAIQGMFVDPPFGCITICSPPFSGSSWHGPFLQSKI